VINPIHQNSDLKKAIFFCPTCISPCLHRESNPNYTLFQSLYGISWLIGTVVSPHVSRCTLLLEVRSFCSLYVDYLKLHGQSAGQQTVPFSTVFTTTRHVLLLLARCIQSAPTYSNLRIILILSSHLHVWLSTWLFLSGFYC
jgi:hypothetical protein